MKKLILILCSLFCFNLFCNAETALKNYIPNTSNVKCLGRTYSDNDSLLMCLSGTGVEFNVKARYLEISFIADSGVRSTDNGSSVRIGIFVNDERKIDELILNKNQTITVFDEKTVQQANIKVVKLSESANSLVALKSISTDAEGSISPAHAKKLKIEFIGDSITCGYGVDDLNSSHHFATKTEDNTKTYAYKTAKMLDADYSMVSFSGFGIVSGYTSGNKNTVSLVPKYYDKLGFSWGSTINGKNPSTIKWNFSSFKPDFVVINLGTNDASYTKFNSDKVTEFVNEYVSFLKTVRANNPEAYIICSLGIMGQDLCPAVSKAVEAYKTQTKDIKIDVLKFDNQNMADGIAADWHPSEKTHQKAAVKLAMKIKEKL